MSLSVCSCNSQRFEQFTLKTLELSLAASFQESLYFLVAVVALNPLVLHANKTKSFFQSFCHPVCYRLKPTFQKKKKGGNSLHIVSFFSVLIQNLSPESTFPVPSSGLFSLVCSLQWAWYRGLIVYPINRTSLYM